LAKKFDAPKVFSDYFLNKVEDAKNKHWSMPKIKRKKRHLKQKVKKASLENMRQ
jgi:hypothetical protein